MKNIAVFGYSVMSLEALERLSDDKFNLLFIAKDETEAALVAEKGFATQIIDFRNDEALKAIGIGQHIDILFCFYPHDSENVFLTISARALDPNLTIVAIIDNPDSAEKLLAAGANKIIDPYEICGRKTYEMLSKPDISNVMDNTVFGRHDLNMAQIEIPPGSPLEYSKSSELRCHEAHNLLLIGIVDKDFNERLYFAIGEKERILLAGDVLVVMGSSKGCKAFKKEIESASSASA